MVLVISGWNQGTMDTVTGTERGSKVICLSFGNYQNGIFSAHMMDELWKKEVNIQLREIGI